VTPAQMAALIGLGTEVTKTIFDVIAELVKGPEPPSMEELRKRLHDAIDARHDDWIAAEKKAAEAEAAKAAAAAYDEPTQP